MHVIEVGLAPDGTDPEAHDETIRAAVISACEEHGEVELRYPDGAPDVARVIDGELIVTAAPPR